MKEIMIETTPFKNAERFRKVIKKDSGKIGSNADFLLDHIDLGMIRRRVTVVAISGFELGFKKEISYKKICEAGEKLGLSLCSEDIGLHFYLYYKKDYSVGNSILVAAKKPLYDYNNGEELAFCMYPGEFRESWLHTSLIKDKVSPETVIIFVKNEENIII